MKNKKEEGEVVENKMLTPEEEALQLKAAAYEVVVEQQKLNNYLVQIQARLAELQK